MMRYHGIAYTVARNDVLARSATRVCSPIIAPVVAFQQVEVVVCASANVLTNVVNEVIVINLIVVTGDGANPSLVGANKVVSHGVVV